MKMLSGQSDDLVLDTVNATQHLNTSGQQKLSKLLQGEFCYLCQLGVLYNVLTSLCMLYLLACWDHGCSDLHIDSRTLHS